MPLSILHSSRITRLPFSSSSDITWGVSWQRTRLFNCQMMYCFALIPTSMVIRRSSWSGGLRGQEALEDLLTIVKRRKLKWYGHVSHSSGLTKPSCKAQWKGEEGKAGRKRGGKTTSRNGQAWRSPSPRGQWRTGKNGGNWLWSHLWCPNKSCG